MLNSQREQTVFSTTDQIPSPKTINQEILDQESLKIQIKNNYKQYLHSIKKSANHKLSLSQILKNFIFVFTLFFQQLCIEIIPQSFRKKYFAEKPSQIMDLFPQLYCGNISFFLRKMKKQGKCFFIILEKALQDTQCFEMVEDLFDNSEESNRKLKYVISPLNKILQFETISLNGDDLKILEKRENSQINLKTFIKMQTKLPLLIVCRYNYLQELKIMGKIELSEMSKHNFNQVLEVLKNHITELCKLQSECKREVLSEFLQN